MDDTTKRLSAAELLDIFSLSQNATAIYTTEDILIEAATDSMIAIWGKDRSIIGKPVEEAIPELKGQPFIRILQDVWHTGIAHELKETPAELPADGRLQTFYFDFVYKAVKKEDGTMRCILHTATDVTERVVSKHMLEQTKQNQQALEREQSLNEELASSLEELRSVNDELTASQEIALNLNNELEERIENRTRDIRNSENRFRSLIEQIPAAINIFLTRDLVVDLPNGRMLEIWGRTFDEVNGKPLDVGMPELKGQPFMQKLRDVIATGIPYSSPEEKAFIQRNGKLEELYFDIVYQPVINPDGSITSCVQIASDVTEEVLSRQRIQALNEELASTNEELSAANEELAAAGEEQVEANQRLADAILQSEIQRDRLNHFFMQAPAGICVLNGPNLEYELINPAYQKLLHGRNLQGRPLFEALPELVGTPLQTALREVYEKGEAKVFVELLIPIAQRQGGKLEDRYFTFHYTPRKDQYGRTNGVMNFVYEVTEQVNSRRVIQQLNIDMQNTIEKLAEREGVLQLALDSASMGLWQIGLIGNATSLSDQMKRIHGIPPGMEMSFEEALGTIAEEYKQPVSEGVARAIETGRLFSADYIIHPVDGSKDRWVRSTGLVTTSNDGSKKMLVGTCLDITEQKQNEQRKSDFIGMVSHEMKTPLTSLNGYLQLLQARAGSDDAFAINMLAKATKQINRMTTLINGFLNVSRLESGKIQIDKQRFDMAQLVKEAEEEVQSTINSHQVVFAPVKTTWVNSDRDKINQVISNLISNAVKYSPANTVIKVACITIDNEAIVSVKDEGIGIKPEDQPKLFDRYYRVNNDNATSASGFGIGLYLCSEIIQRHGGKIWVESEVGNGSTFSFSLPVVE